MDDQNGMLAKGGKVLPSLLEKMVDGRFFVLLLSFLVYLDIWLLGAGIDPTKLDVVSGLEALKRTSLFTLMGFFVFYSLLMVGFRVVRWVFGLIRLNFRSGVFLTEQTPESRRVSDWSLAFLVFSAYDLAIGYFFVRSDYKGLGVFVVNFWQVDGFAVMVFRVCVGCLFLACAAFAFEVDHPRAEARS